MVSEQTPWSCGGLNYSRDKRRNMKWDDNKPGNNFDRKIAIPYHQFISDETYNRQRQVGYDGSNPTNGKGYVACERQLAYPWSHRYHAVNFKYMCLRK
jgi:hypothetical protein